MAEENLQQEAGSETQNVLQALLMIRPHYKDDFKIKSGGSTFLVICQIGHKPVIKKESGDEKFDIQIEGKIIDYVGRTINLFFRFANRFTLIVKNEGDSFFVTKVIGAS